MLWQVECVCMCVCVFCSFWICYVCLMKPASFWLLQDQVCQAPSIWHDFDVEIQGARAQAATDQPRPVCLCVCDRERERERKREIQASTNTAPLLPSLTNWMQRFWLKHVQSESIQCWTNLAPIHRWTCFRSGYPSASIISVAAELEFPQ